MDNLHDNSVLPGSFYFRVMNMYGIDGRTEKKQIAIRNEAFYREDAVIISRKSH